jgi:hypothetical protein
VTEPPVRMLDELGAEFARVAALPEARRSRRPAKRRGAVALALVAALLVSGVAYAVPATRAAIEDVAGWLAGDDGAAPGRAVRPDDDAPSWVREHGGRLIAESGGVGLYVTRTESQDGTQLNFSLGKGIGLGDSLEGWREQFDEHAIVVLGPASVRGEPWDRRGRFPVLGLTARSVERVELRYDRGPPLAAGGLQGGFVLMADARRALREIVAYDAAGRELERTDVGHIDMRSVCRDVRGCPPGRLDRP